MTLPWLLVALTTGLIGSLHCVGMCGPLAMALPVGRLPQSQRWLGVGLYHLMRIMAYAGIGVVAGSLGQGLVLAGMQRFLSIGAGVTIVAWTLLIRGRFAGLSATAPTRWLVAPMAGFLRQPSLVAFAGLGFLNGLLPCGFVYVALAGAFATGQALGSALYMALFGLGTVPALLAIRLAPTLFPVRLRQQFTKLMPLVAVGLGALLLVRGMSMSAHTESVGLAIPLCHGRLTVSK